MSTGTMKTQTDMGRGNVDVTRSSWGWMFTLGLALIAVGFLAICIPIVATLAIEIVIGWLLIIGGIIHCFTAFSSKNWGRRALNLFGAVLYAVVGILMLGHPVAGMLTLTLLLAAFFFVEGVFKMALSLQMRSMPNWGWMFVSGLVALALGVMIWMGWPDTAAWALGLLLGVDLVFGGWSMVFIALSVKELGAKTAA